MENKKKLVATAEKKIWHLVLLSVVVILYTTLVLISYHFSDLLENHGIFLVDHGLWRYSVFLSVLVLLFCAYVIVQQRKLLFFSQAISEEKRTAEMLSKNVEILSALLEVSSSINSQEDLSDILHIVTREMLACFHADHSSIMLLDRKTKFLSTKASYGVGAEYAKDALIPLGKSIAGWVVANNQPLLLNGQVDVEKFPGTQRKDRTISSSLCVPLKLQQKSIGVLNVNLVDRVSTFEENDLKLLTIFANNAAVAIHNSLLLKEKDERVRLQTMLEQLHSPQVVTQLVERIKDGTKPNTMREKVEMTILFSDIRGFSSMLNVVEPEDIMGFLDEFYSVMNKAVFDNEGSIDKFIGDEVMAFFGAPIHLENSTRSGLQSAKQMIDYFQHLKTKFSTRSSFFENLGLGIGLNTGEVFVGNVGSDSRYEYTVIGTSVNLARRLCAYAGSNQILTTAGTLEKVRGELDSQALENLSFKGIPQSVTVHKIEWPM